MYITLHLVDGRKITKERENMIIMSPRSAFSPHVEPGKITVNWANVMYMCEAEPEEIEHSRTHGW